MEDNKYYYVDEKVLKALILKIAQMYRGLDGRIKALEDLNIESNIADITKLLEEDVLFGDEVK